MIDAHRLGDYVFSLPAFAWAARLSVHHGDVKEAHRQLARAMRARPSATYLLPYLAVRLRLQLARVYLAIAEPATARQLLREIDDIVSHRPALGALIGQVDEFRRALASSVAIGTGGRLALTPAELRLLPYLLSANPPPARGIADRLLISRHTVETQVKSLYRKLGVTSRDDAVQQATAIGLLSG
jgi:LuxR family transcriptional regulator, maltose regulon positive regulatory protein